jgi:Flp pilus assembly protein TadG
MELKKKIQSRSGQAGIEFMGVMVVIFFFLFFFMSLAITLIVSDYLEYATFMAARTYKAGASSKAKQEEHAQLVFDTYFQKIQGIARNPAPLSFIAADANDNQTQGVLASYTVDLFYMPPVFITQGSPGSTMNLNAEAHLGRDPSFEDCIGFFEEFGQKVLGIQNGALVDQLEDNGC